VKISRYAERQEDNLKELVFLPSLLRLLFKLMKTGKAHILCTEDHDDSREIVVLFLETAGYQVTCTQSPAEAIRLTQQQPYDLLLVDNWMPEMSGVQLTREIRKFDASTPILFYSGAGYESDKKDAKEAGAQGYLVKPQGIAELVNEVARLIAEAKTVSHWQVDVPGLREPADDDAKESLSEPSEITPDFNRRTVRRQRYGTY
jgi:DNA-binding response OmpR family regulator